MLSPAWSWYDRCGWCKNRILDSPEFVTATFRSKEDIPYESGQYIDRIIFLTMKEKPLTFANIFKEEDPWIGDKKAIPVFCIPFRDDDKNFVVMTCSNECAESVKTAVENEAYVFQWNF